MTEREEKLLDLLAQALPYLEDVAEFHEECMKEAGKARFRQLIRDVRSEVEARQTLNQTAVRADQVRQEGTA